MGRFIGSWLLTKVRTGTVLGTAALVACALVATSILTAWAHGDVRCCGGAVQLGDVPEHLCKVGLTGLGPLTSKGSSLMVAAIVGGALIPLAEGHPSRFDQTLPTRVRHSGGMLYLHRTVWVFRWATGGREVGIAAWNVSPL